MRQLRGHSGLADRERVLRTREGRLHGSDRTPEGPLQVGRRGTLFLDEIGELPLDLQAKLLRVLQDGEFERVGGSERIRIDEPLELCGTNQFANPQEYLMAAVNSCIMVGYAAACALNGIELESLRLETEGDIDLRGFLGIDAAVPAGYEEIRYKVFIKAKATEEQLREVHDFVSRTAPNRYNMMNAIPMKTTLVVEA